MKKLNNKKGFSLPISMVFLLVAVMLSVVLVGTALSAVRLAHKRQEDRQASLLVTSSAEVLSSAILGMEFHVDYEEPGEGVAVGPNTYTVAITPMKENGYPDLAKYVSTMLALAEKSGNLIYPSLGAAPANASFEIESTSGIVVANVTMYALESDNYPGDIVVSLQKKDADVQNSNFCTTFRLDGQYVPETKEFYFTGVTYYPGTGVYK